MNWMQYLTFDNVMVALFLVPLGILAWSLAGLILWQLVCDIVFRR